LGEPFNSLYLNSKSNWFKNVYDYDITSQQMRRLHLQNYSVYEHEVHSEYEWCR